MWQFSGHEIGVAEVVPREQRLEAGDPARDTEMIRRLAAALGGIVGSTWLAAPDG